MLIVLLVFFYFFMNFEHQLSHILPQTTGFYEKYILSNWRHATTFNQENMFLMLATKYIYKYVFRAVGCFPGPYLAKRFTEVHIN